MVVTTRPDGLPPPTWLSWPLVSVAEHTAWTRLAASPRPHQRHAPPSSRRRPHTRSPLDLVKLQLVRTDHCKTCCDPTCRQAVRDSGLVSQTETAPITNHSRPLPSLHSVSPDNGRWAIARTSAASLSPACLCRPGSRSEKKVNVTSTEVILPILLDHV